MRYDYGFAMNFFNLDGSVCSKVPEEVSGVSGGVFEKYYFDNFSYASLISESFLTKKIKITIDACDAAYCYSCVYDRGGVWLFFKNKEITFWILQRNSRVVYIYFSALEIVATLLGSVDKNNLGSARPILREAELNAGARPANFIGMLLGSPRPFHYISDNYTFLHESYFYLSKNSVSKVPLYCLKGQTFLSPRFYHDCEDLNVVAESDVSSLLEGNNCFLRVSRGGNQSFDNFSFRRKVVQDKIIVSSCVDRKIERELSCFDFVLWVSAASEKRSWLDQEEFLEKILNHLCFSLGYKVLVLLDGMTSSIESMDEGSRLRSFSTRKVEIFSEGKRREVDFYDMAMLTIDEKILLAKNASYAVSNSMTDSIVISRFLSCPGVGFCANSEKGFFSQIHPNFIHVPRNKVLNNSIGFCATKTSFSISPEYVLDLVMSDLDFIFSKDRVFKLRSNSSAISLVSEGDSTYFVNSGDKFVLFEFGGADYNRELGQVSSVVFKGEASHGVSVKVNIHIEREGGKREVVFLRMGRVHDFEFDLSCKILDVKGYVSGVGVFKINGLCVVKNNPICVDYIGWS